MGGLKVVVCDHGGAIPREGIRVTVANSTALTEADGTAFFSGLEAGKYEILTDLGENELGEVRIFDGTVTYVKMMYY